MSAQNNLHSWRPTADMASIKVRAKILAEVREFFAARDVLEVETPMLCARSITDPYIQPFVVNGKYLQTSPEYPMKRLIAAGFGSIYQICKVFRQEEAGNLHNTEFTMLEWYRVGFDHHKLMSEVDALLQCVLEQPQRAHKFTYQEIFDKFVGINPHTADIDLLQACASAHNINLSAAVIAELNATDWLHLLMSHVIEPQLTGIVPWIIYDFPVAQASLAKVIPGSQPVAARFEVYMQGIELANGYYELLESDVHIKRFEQDNLRRSQLGINTHQLDERLLAALDTGMPDCAGVALGFDRLLMLKLQKKSIADVLTFTCNNA